jgi:hypothetical protein
MNELAEVLQLPADLLVLRARQAQLTQELHSLDVEITRTTQAPGVKPEGAADIRTAESDPQ